MRWGPLKRARVGALLAGCLAAVMMGPGLAAAPAAASAVLPAAPGRTGLGAAALCERVSARSVSRAVGHAVPSPAATRATSSFDQAKRITGTLTSCTYGQDKTNAQIRDAVEIDYATLSKPVTLSLLKQEMRHSLTASAKVKMADYHGLRVPAVYIVAKEDGGTVEVMAGVKGNKLIIVGLGTAAPEAEVAAVARLAVKAFI